MTSRYLFWASILMLASLAHPASAQPDKQSGKSGAATQQQKQSTGGDKAAAAGRGGGSAARGSSAGSAPPTDKAASAAGSAPAKPVSKASPSGSASGPRPGTQPPSNKAAAAPTPATKPGVLPGGAKKSPAAGQKPTPREQASTYTVRLRDLESRVDELKEQIRRSHTRLSLLSETILSGGLGGARAEIVFRNELSNAFRVVGLTFVLDGSVQYTKEDETGALSKRKEIPIFSGPVPPGDHTMQVIVRLRGHGYGVFSYLKAYKPTVKRTHSFTIDEGKSARVEIVVWEKGGPTTPVEQRPSLRFVRKSMELGENEAAEAE